MYTLTSDILKIYRKLLSSNIIQTGAEKLERQAITTPVFELTHSQSTKCAVAITSLDSYRVTFTVFPPSLVSL